MEVQIVSGFLGAGKTTFLNKYLPLLKGKTVVIENEFGDVGLDGELIQGDIPVKELYAGCICCSLALDFQKGIKELTEQFHPDRIVIEPSGVGRLTDVVKACGRAKEKEGIDLRITKLIVILDITEFEDYIDGFGAFYLDQIQNAGLILLSHLEQVSKEEKNRLISEIREVNPDAVIYEDDWRKMEGAALLELLDMSEDYENDPEDDMEEIMMSPASADKIFSSMSIENAREMTAHELEKALYGLKDEKYGKVLRAKGIVKAGGGRVLHFDFTPSIVEVADISDTVKGTKVDKIIIIGCNLNETAIWELFSI